ncbi:response regulator transcription factor [Nannocystis sp. ILAH1]|uniref:response regulator transcription factor n=1 Tax=Nannocystis sp. ILAH1 TaxID=2996789 RepID=UPI0022706F19|nr:response regulator transcription factor [Nannocystis sp. ILAH1]MCY0993109.1 response regulator transcription factor [Nannocystis sp. ILAH1]
MAGIRTQVLREEDFTVDICLLGFDALQQARRIDYDAMLLDRMLPDIDGLSVCTELRRQGQSVPILILSNSGSAFDRVDGLEAGADDYMIRPFEVSELVARIKALHRRVHRSRRALIGPLEFDRLHRVVMLSGSKLSLTEHEYTLLLFLAERCGEIISRSELLAHVWPKMTDSRSNLIEVQISRLRQKLGSHAQIIQTVRSHGYRLRCNPP